MSTSQYPKHVQSMSWYKKLAQLYVMETITSRVASMMRQTKDYSDFITQTMLEKLESVIQKGVK